MTEQFEFRPFPKMALLSRDCIITEKIDGTNAQIYIEGDVMLVGSRNRWLRPEADNFGFAKWAEANKEELFKLGEGRHFGEWWGNGIQRGYGLKNGDKRFSLFNPSWHGRVDKPACCSVVPILYSGIFATGYVEDAISRLAILGSQAAPGFMKPEGIVIYHVAAGVGFKKTIENDASPKGLVTSPQ